MGGRVMLGVIIGKVVPHRPPVDQELSLACPVLDPIKTHVDCFRLFLFDGVIGETFGSGVVDLHRRWWLRMSHLLERGPGTRWSAVGVGVTLGDDVVAAWKIAAMVRMAWSCSFPMVAKGAAGVGFSRAEMRSSEAQVAASAEEVLGMAQLCGKNSTVLAMRSA
jgi:hypothetical protein